MPRIKRKVVRIEDVSVQKMANGCYYERHIGFWNAAQIDRKKVFSLSCVNNNGNLAFVSVSDGYTGVVDGAEDDAIVIRSGTSNVFQFLDILIMYYD